MLIVVQYCYNHIFPLLYIHPYIYPPISNVVILDFTIHVTYLIWYYSSTPILTLFNCLNVFLSIYFTFLITHLVGSIIAFSIDSNVVVFVDILGVLNANSLIYLFILFLSSLYWQLLPTVAWFNCVLCKSCCHQNFILFLFQFSYIVTLVNIILIPIS